MSDFSSLQDFLEPVQVSRHLSKKGFSEGQIGKHIEIYEDDFPDLYDKDIIIIGCGETRGCGNSYGKTAPDVIREYFYELYYWHKDVKIADAGNIRTGAGLNDTYAALKTVLKELSDHTKTIVIIGGSHDLTLAQYNMYVDKKSVVEAVCVDALIDLNIESPNRCGNFLMEMLTSEPNYIRHYNHIGFQSYYVHPHMLETMDKLRFDCYRVGSVKENIDEMEPVIRNSSLFTFDISAIANSYAPANELSPNGFTGEEACALLRFAGLSPNVNTVGIYGYMPEKDHDYLTAKQISHMLWYLIDGKSRGRREASLDERDSFVEYHTAFAEVETTFLQSRKTNRWWMQLPDKKYIACSYKDYLLASSNEIPERWMRAQERV
ncbi:MAG TPA: formimidoylglutamase [Puia sp.]|jgi:arginase family enzyme|nr:formimidoylglutamase [Puia sp.]